MQTMQTAKSVTPITVVSKTGVQRPVTRRSRRHHSVFPGLTGSGGKVGSIEVYSQDIQKDPILEEDPIYVGSFVQQEASSRISIFRNIPSIKSKNYGLRLLMKLVAMIIIVLMASYVSGLIISLIG
jgi:hypothetical protein